jgi:taurine dioxygenase
MSGKLSTSTLPSSAFGLEVDIDLRRPLDLAEQQEFRDLFYRNHLLLFRGQQLQPEDHARICGYLGPILRDPEESMGYISNVRPDGGLGSTALAFHSDLAFCPTPFDAISLYATDVVNDATSTVFANGARAYGMLADELKARLDSLDAMHVFMGQMAGRNRATGLGELGPEVPHATHPLIMRHPVSGIPIVYANYMLTDSIVGLDPDDSEQIIQNLFSVLYEPANTYEHRWRLNDLLIWDNLALQHARGDVSKVGNRTLHRVVNATASLYDTYPQFRDPKYRT